MFEILARLDSFFWSYLGFSFIMLLGIYFTIQTKGFQIREIPTLFRTFFYFLQSKGSGKQGTHPLKVFFASTGGMIGVGNIVGIITALQISGPGAVFWVWIAAFFGSIIKYAEVFLGLKYRKANKEGGFDGGSIYFLQKAFNVKWIGPVICILLGIYGVEIYQFSVLTNTLSYNWNLPYWAVMVSLLALIFYTVIGGIKRIGKICSLLMPFFILIYLAMSLWVIGHHLDLIPSLVKEIIYSAFTGKSLLGGLVGGSVLLAIQQGISRSVYSADIGIGYDSIIQSETSALLIQRQARLAMFGVFVDNLTCTCSLFVALTSGLWCSVPALPSALVVQTALSQYFPFQYIFMPTLFFVLAYTTLISYLFVGLKCARYLNKSYGEKVYLFFALLMFTTFSFFSSAQALLIMSVAGCILLCTNLLGIFLLRREVDFAPAPLPSRDPVKV